jgi:hypothetical protein
MERTTGSKVFRLVLDIARNALKIATRMLPVVQDAETGEGSRRELEIAAASRK